MREAWRGRWLQPHSSRPAMIVLGTNVLSELMNRDPIGKSPGG
jgi:hypothetical protein